jgi:hypothetical protein
MSCVAPCMYVHNRLVVGPAPLGRMTPAKTLENICVVTDDLTDHLAMEWNQLGEEEEGEKEKKKERKRERERERERNVCMYITG